MVNDKNHGNVVMGVRDIVMVTIHDMVMEVIRDKVTKEGHGLPHGHQCLRLRQALIDEAICPRGKSPLWGKRLSRRARVMSRSHRHQERGR